MTDKSVSRFARNTVDSLNTIRQLKEKGIECYFEKENIWTFDGKGELLLTIMSSLAQEESRSLSQNVTWGQRKRFADGKVSMPYKRFLGYERGEDGTPKIVESEAKVVRQIYQSYLQGQTIRQIADALTAQGTPTPGGKEQWSVSTIKSILQNVEYKGDALLQKSFVVDFLTKKSKRNEGEIPQFYVTGSHPAIISAEVFQLVQEEIARNSLLGSGRSNASCFSGRVLCPACAEFFGAKTWHSKDIYKKRVWQCNGKYRERRNEHCQTPHLTEEQLQAVFVQAFNQIIGDKERYISNMVPAIALLTDCAELDGEAEILQERGAGLYAQLEELTAESARCLHDQAAYQERYNNLNRRYEAVQAQLEQDEIQRRTRAVKRAAMHSFLEAVRQRDDLLTAFDEPLWRSTVDFVTAHALDNIVVRFRDGKAIRVDVSLL